MSFFTPDTTYMTSFEERGRFVMAWRLSIIFTLVFSILTFLVIPISVDSASIYGLIVVIASLVTLHMYLTKTSQVAFWTYAISASLVSQFTLNVILDTAHYTDFIWILSTIVFAFVGLGKIPGLIILAFHSIGIGFYVAFNMNTHFDLVPPHNLQQKIILYVELLMGFVTMGYLLNQYIVFQNYSKEKLQRLNRSLEAQNETILAKNKENITLVKEVHHRVKNNLQIIVSLLRMQRSEIDSKEAEEHFTVAINRILTMSMIHQMLYQEKEPNKINMKEYLNDLINELISLEVRKHPIKIHFEASEEFADLKTIVPFGLLVNELVANSMKHAFRGSGEDTIDIKLESNGKKKGLIFHYKDNGEWLEPSKDGKGFGLELIDILTEQMEGNYERKGSSYTFEISLEEI